MKKLKLFPLNLLAIAMLAIFTVSCEKETINLDNPSDPSVDNAIALKGKLPTEIDKQLNAIKSNLNKHTGETFKLLNYTTIDKKNVDSKVSFLKSSGEEGIAYGNIAEPSTVIFSKMNELSSLSRQTVSNDINSYKTELIKPSDDVMTLTWEANGKEFTSVCHYNSKGIVWDNVIFGLFEALPEGEETKGTRNSDKSMVEEDWYKRWWTVNWIFGSKRGEMGYQITIYYNGNRVSNTDRRDWAYINLGKEKSESRITKNSGSHGKIKYALGLATPTATLSFDRNGFTVSSGGIGSSSVQNGTKSLYP